MNTRVVFVVRAIIYREHSASGKLVREYHGVGSPGRNWFGDIEKARVYTNTGHAKNSITNFRYQPKDARFFVQPVRVEVVYTAPAEEYNP